MVIDSIQKLSHRRPSLDCLLPFVPCCVVLDHLRLCLPRARVFIVRIVGPKRVRVDQAERCSGIAFIAALQTRRLHHFLAYL